MIFSKRIIVIGGNAAGCAAAAKAKRVNPNASVMLFEKSRVISTGTCELPYVISGEIESAGKLVFYTPETFESEKGVKVFIENEVVHINTSKKLVDVLDLKTRKIQSFPFDALVIATGSHSRGDESISAVHYENQFQLKTVRDAELITRYMNDTHPKNAVIIGGGYIGLELADALTRRGLTVSLIEKQQALFQFAGDETSALIKTLCELKGVNIYFSVDSFKYISENGKIGGVRIGSRTIETDIVFLAEGFTPENLLAKDAKLTIGNSAGIKVSSRLQTSAPYVFAAGDCIEYKEFISGQNIFLPQANLAHRSGHVAGANSAGGNEYMPTVVRNLSARFFDKYFAHIGLTTEELLPGKIKIITESIVHQNIPRVMPGSKPNFSKIICDKNSGKILSATCFGGNEVSSFADIISTFIRFGRSAVELQDIQFNYTPTLSPLINPLSILGKKIQLKLNNRGK